MHRSRTHYWSCSDFSQWLRRTFGGIEKPGSETWQGWSDWREAAKARNAFVYWLTETGLDKVQNFLYFPYDVYDNVRIYISNRFFVKTHYLKTKLEPGQWYDGDTRLLHGMFETLVDFIEVEKAWMRVVWHDKEDWEKFGFPWWYRYRVLRWARTFRSAEAGIDFLNWEMTLGDDPSGQAHAAKEQYELYKWWKDVRPARKDPFEKSLIGEEGWMIDKMYDDEDTEMLIRLIKIRKSLWT